MRHHSSRTSGRPNRTNSIRTIAITFAAAAVLAACAPPPTPPDWPDPMVSCTSMGGPISYDPPASTGSGLSTISSGAGFDIEGCTSFMPAAVDNITVVRSSAVLDACGSGAQPNDALLGSGSGRLHWDDGAQTVFDLDILATGSPGSWQLQMDFTVGRWAGARADVVLAVVSSDGNCVSTPVSAAVLTNATPFVVHPD